MRDAMNGHATAKRQYAFAPAAVNALNAHDVTRLLVAGRTGRRRLRTDTLCSSLATNVPALLAEGDARGTFAIIVRTLAVPTARVRGAASFVTAARCRVVGNIVIVMGHRHVARIRVSTLRCAHLRVQKPYDRGMRANPWYLCWYPVLFLPGLLRVLGRRVVAERAPAHLREDAVIGEAGQAVGRRRRAAAREAGEDGPRRVGEPGRKALLEDDLARVGRAVSAPF